ncbi:MAG: protein kinase [Gemmatimonadaceae bacterium]
MPPTNADDDVHRQLQAALHATYSIERELHGGGQSRVFVALETALGRRVVVKVLSPDVAQDLSAERFEREIRVAAQLQHPNILPVLTAGVAGDIPYYTMPFVDGEALRARINLGDRLPIDETLSVLRDVARALAYAHGRGVIHRDIKPENILVSGDAVVVADFGIAKALSDASRTDTPSPKSENLTRHGTALGTPAYMAPEQAIGDPRVDHRADVYSWGVVAYELLAGRHPFAHKLSPYALINAHLTERPAPLNDLSATHPALASLVMRALEKDPDHRPPSARHLVDALSSIGFLTPGDALVPRSVLFPSVAVLPFANLSGNVEDEYFSDGMTEEAINALGRMPGLRVAARTSSFAFKGVSTDLPTIARQLRVETILEGAVRRSGTRVRISVQLVSAADGLQLWSERYDRELSDVFALQDEIGLAIANALRERFGSANWITPPERHTPRPVDLAAYDLYLRGRFLFEQHNPVEALASFERAVAADPGFALAHAWSGSALMMSANLGMMPSSVAYERAKLAAESALAIEPRLAEGHVLGAIYALWYDRDFEEAERRARQAAAIAPSMPHAHEFIAWSLLAQHRFADGIESMERACALDPLSDFMLVNLAIAYTFGGWQDRGLNALRPALVRSPGNGSLHYVLGLTLLTSDRPLEACVAFERAWELRPNVSLVAAGLSCAYAATGDAERATRMLRVTREMAERGRGSALDVGVAYHWLGDDEQALAWFDRALNANEMMVAFLSLDPRLNRLRAAPAFQDLLRRTKRRRDDT